MTQRRAGLARRARGFRRVSRETTPGIASRRSRVKRLPLTFQCVCMCSGNGGPRSARRFTWQRPSLACRIESATSHSRPELELAKSCAAPQFHVKRSRSCWHCSLRPPNWHWSPIPPRYNPPPHLLRRALAGGQSRWAGSCAWPIRKAASARRPPPSTWPPPWPRPAQRTLLVDLDPQCNATSGLGQQPTESHPLVSRAAAQGVAVHRPTVATLGTAARQPAFHDVEALATRRRQPGRHAQPAPGQRADCLRLRADRLPALAWAS